MYSVFHYEWVSHIKLPIKIKGKNNQIVNKLENLPY